MTLHPDSPQLAAALVACTTLVVTNKNLFHGFLVTEEREHAGSGKTTILNLKGNCLLFDESFTG